MSGEVLAPTALSEAPEPDEDQPREIRARHSVQDQVFVHSARGVGLIVLAIVLSIGIFLGAQSFPTLNHYGLSFFTEFR